MQARSVFSQQIFQGGDVQHRRRQQLLQPPVLVLQRPSASGPPTRPCRRTWPSTDRRSAR
jgi:hypothetical protein